MDAGPERARRRLWINLGEAVAIVAVVIAALNYWDSHRQRQSEAAAARASAAASATAESLVLEAQPQDGGRRLALRAASPGQIIQSQRYVFPTAVLAHPMEVDAAQPQIDAGWIDGGLGKALDQKHAPGQGEARAPVVVITSYIENGVARRDQALYAVGFAWKHHFLGGREIRLQGIALRRRLPPGDAAAAANAAWADLHISGGGPT